MGPRNHVLDGGPDPLMGRDNFLGEGRSIVKYRDTLWSSDPMEIPFGLWARMGHRNHESCVTVLGGRPAVLRDVAMTTNFGTKIATKY